MSEELPHVGPQGSDHDMLVTLQRETFEYFRVHANPINGLIADSAEPGVPASIAATGLGLAAYPVAVERGLCSRDDAIARTLATLRFFHACGDATGHHGFYYHFLDMRSGARAWTCELSTIDTALLIIGMLLAGQYFTRDDEREREIRELADALYRRVDWPWAALADGTMRHGWTPEHGFLPYAWDRGLSEALLLYVLALGSPTFALDAAGYRAWTATFERATFYDIDHLYAGPLFIHQLPHLGIDFRGIRDDRNREIGFDYFENSRRATLIQRAYAIENPRGFAHYSENGWGLTASNGPGPAVRVVDGVRREFFGYLARGAPRGPDDGTLSPWAVVASLPFAPEVVCDAVRHAIERLGLKNRRELGFDASYNRTFPDPQGGTRGWIAPWKLGLNEGPIILMIENHLSGMPWSSSRTCPYITEGLRRAGFTGAWLG